MFKIFVTLMLWGMLTADAVTAETVAGDENVLRSLVADAVSRKLDNVRIPPGVYRLGKDPKDDKAHLLLANIKNLQIDGTGVELIFTRIQGTNGIVLRDCANVVLKGFTIDLEPICFTQGLVNAIAPDWSYYDLKIDIGYETDPAAFRNRFRMMSVFDPETRLWKRGVEDIFIDEIELPEPGVWRVWVKPDRRRKLDVAVNDPAAVAGVGGCAITATGSADLGYDHITVYQAGAIAFHEHGGAGNTHIRNCNVTRRPGTDRLLSSNADGFHCKNMRKGPTVEDSTFEYMQDDGINIHGMFGFVKEEVNGNQLILLPRFESGILAGDTLEFFDPETHASKGKFKVAKVGNLPNLPPGEAALYGPLSGIVKSVSLETAVQLAARDRYINLSASGAGFVIRNNQFGPLRYRGMLIRTADGMIENNTVHDTGNGGIYLESCFGVDSEGPYVQNVIVRNNTLTNIGAFPGWDKGFGIWVVDFNWPKPQTADLAHNHNQIQITGNRIDGTANTGIRVMNADDVTIFGNVLQHIGSRRNFDQKNIAPISVTDSVNVRQNDNQIIEELP